MPSCTSSREPAQQTWPWLNQMPSTSPSTALSRSASSKTMKADLPPSSSDSFLPEPAVALRMILPTSDEPVKAIFCDAGMIDDRRTRVRAARQDVDDALRHAGALADLGEQDRGQRRELGRLQHHRAAGGERRRDLPGEHQQRKIPRDDLADDAGRLVAGKLAVERLRPAGMMQEMADRQRHVDVAALADRLAVVDRFQHREQALVALHGAADGVEHLGALVAGRGAPFRQRLARRPQPPHRHRPRRRRETLASSLPVDGLAARRRSCRLPAARHSPPMNSALPKSRPASQASASLRASGAGP